MSASRWAQLSASRLPIDLTHAEQVERNERTRRAQEEIARIQACVDALDPRRTAAARSARHCPQAFTISAVVVSVAITLRVLSSTAAPYSDGTPATASRGMTTW